MCSGLLTLVDHPAQRDAQRFCQWLPSNAAPILVPMDCVFEASSIPMYMVVRFALLPLESGSGWRTEPGHLAERDDDDDHDEQEG